MKILAKIGKILTLVIITTIMAASSIFAQTSENPPTELVLFVSDTCEHCEALLTELKERELMSYVVVKEVSSDENLEEFRSVVQKCDTRSAVPLLYDGVNCFHGQFEVTNVILPAAGLEPIDPTPSYEEIQKQKDLEANSAVDEELIDNGESDDSSTKIPTDTSDSETGSDVSETLADVLNSSMDGNSGEPIPISVPTILMMFIAPALFFGIAYLLLSKMKV